MINLSDDNTKSNTKRFPQEMNGLSQYDIPLLLHPNPEKYLIVGAGAGNDVAGGLRQNAKEITAVEIDPAIIYLGKKYHPEKPDAPNVRIVNDDARSYFAKCRQKYNVISFGLLDSHTTTAMTNARLDHYVYTRESIARAKELLAEDGLMVLTFEATKPFIADRMANMLSEVFGAKPISFSIPGTSYGWGGVMFIAGDTDLAKRQIEKNQRLKELISKWKKNDWISLAYTTRITTDDWPYVYLEDFRIPTLYYLMAVLVLLLLIRCRKHLGTTHLVKQWSKSSWHFAILGAAFLLLEVQNISKASVVFGNTWQVNAVIVSGVLFMILLANLLVAKYPHIPLKLVYTLLCGACLCLYWVDIAKFAGLPYASKVPLVGGLTTLPMLFAGIVFIRSFATISEKDKALGANLIGALAGGLLQSVTFVIGIKALLLIITGLYFLAMLTGPKQTQKLHATLAAQTS